VLFILRFRQQHLEWQLVIPQHQKAEGTDAVAVFSSWYCINNAVKEDDNNDVSDGTSMFHHFHSKTY